MMNPKSDRPKPITFHFPLITHHLINRYLLHREALGGVDADEVLSVGEVVDGEGGLECAHLAGEYESSLMA